MTIFRRFIPLLAWLLGLLGVAACAAAIAVVWSTGSQLSKTSENVFDGIETSFSVLRDRVLGAQSRVQELKIRTEDIGHGVKNWTRKEATERLASRLELENKAEQLALALRQVDLWLEMSGASLQGVQQALEIASSLGAPADSAIVDPLLERLGALRRQLKQSTETVNALCEGTAKPTEGEALEARISQLAQVALRVVATLGEIDSHLGEFSERLAATQIKGQHLKRKTHVYIVMAQICVAVLIVWMAAGQVSLCRHGWNDYRRARWCPTSVR